MKGKAVIRELKILQNEVEFWDAKIQIWASDYHLGAYYHAVCELDRFLRVYGPQLKAMGAAELLFNVED